MTPHVPVATLRMRSREIISESTGITVKINRRAYSSVLRHANLPADTLVPWWDGRQLHFEVA